MKKRRPAYSESPLGDPEPVQVYLSGPDRARLTRLTNELGISKSEVLRRGLEALEAQRERARGPRVGPPIPTYNGGGFPAGINFDCNREVLDALDEDDAAP